MKHVPFHHLIRLVRMGLGSKNHLAMVYQVLAAKNQRHKCYKGEFSVFIDNYGIRINRSR